MSESRTEISSLGEFGLIDHLTKNIELQNASSVLGVVDRYWLSDHHPGMRRGRMGHPAGADSGAHRERPGWQSRADGLHWCGILDSAPAAELLHGLGGASQRFGRATRHVAAVGLGAPARAAGAGASRRRAKN